MSLLKEISEAHEDIKSLLLSLIIAPFWVTAIYLFNFDFYRKADYLILGAIVIILCLSGFLLGLLNSYTIRLIREDKRLRNNTDKEGVGGEEKSNSKLMLYSILSVFCNCLWLSFIIFFGYTGIKFYNYTLDFYGIVCAFFLPNILSFVILVILYIQRVYKKLVADMNQEP